MNFRIGKMAKLLSMSSEGLRLYERSGIIKPQRDDGDNSYRTYEHLDFTALIRARGYHYAGFSTKEISYLLNAKCVGDIIAGYETREKELEQEIHYKKQLLQNLRDLKAVSADAEHKLWKIERQVRPAMYRFPFISDGNYLLDSKQEKIFTKWLQKTPFVFIYRAMNGRNCYLERHKLRRHLVFLKNSFHFFLWIWNMPNIIPPVLAYIRLCRSREPIFSRLNAFIASLNMWTKIA